MGAWGHSVIDGGVGEGGWGSGLHHFEIHETSPVSRLQTLRKEYKNKQKHEQKETENKVLKVSYCDYSVSVLHVSCVVSISTFMLFTL